MCCHSLTLRSDGCVVAWAPQVRIFRSRPTLTASGPSGIEELREKREDLNRSVAQDEEEKGAPAMGPGGEA